MDVDEVARSLYARASADEQAAMRCDADTPTEAIRRRVRELARAAGVRIRTGSVDDVLVVVRVDARVWTESAEVMRRKLAVPPTPASSGLLVDPESDGRA